ncbi:MFS general substrate transporter [Aspergillus sclerotiicarbonarius CBS 121057]|uniref:MFS general substrate transporter n=1 Tax=Aspergillus sclerotiicarbonarius (strain CBS 121057 / IBT 28362) TaxID=1448318 RepID=A0A319EWZ9_ASPSB|nr:MFS general substrate transporter [Aspergillus sclerotiicarbonarius CBS 121057]
MLSNLEDGLVGWESQEDPENPQNFPSGRKWLILGLVSGITFLSPFTSSMPAPGMSFIDQEFGTTSEILTSFAVSVFVLGFAVGPLVLSPLSEIYGRQPILNAANIFFTAWQIGCALAPNMASLIIFRFLAGVGGSACLTIGGGIISDLFPLALRGKANAVFSAGPLFGPVLGPIIGGFIAERAGWRWTFWVLLIACAVMTTANIIFNRESNATVIIQRKAERLQKELNRPDLRNVYHADQGTRPSPSAALTRGVTRPFRILFRSPILLLLTLYMSFVFGLLYLLLTTITSLFTGTYHWAAELAGLSYLGIGLGFALGLVAVGATSDKTVVRLTAANQGIYEPEMRLASCLMFALFVPISFFWYGWSADKHVHWIVPIIGLMPFGFGMMGIFAPIQTYFIDACGPYAASAIAGLTAIRCLFGAFLPLAGPSMYSALGLGWGNSLLGFIALALTPAPALIYKYGAAFRKKYATRLD